MLTRLRNSRRGFTAVELVVVIVVLAIVMTVTLVQVDKRRQARLRAESAANLRMLHRVLSEVWDTETSAVANYWLPLSATPGQLTPALSGRYETLREPESLGAFISPAHPDAERMRRDALANPESAITDASYWYFGFALTTEEAGLAYVDAYKKAIKDTGKPPTENIEVVSVGSGGNESGMISTIRALKSLELVGRHSLSAQYSARKHLLIRLLPILIERPGLQRGGSNVLFLDGHVEFIPYPGSWPMTEKFIKALESLDELKEEE